MSKITSALAGVLSAAALLGAGYWFLRKTDIIHVYPDPVYLEDSEAEKRSYYMDFNDNDKAVYTALLNGISQHKEEIDLPFDINGQTYERLYCILEKQECDKFYIDSSFYNAEKINRATIVYRDSEKDFDSMKNEVEKSEKQALEGITDDMDDYSKALLIHDYIVNNCDYVNTEDGVFGSTVYGCLVEKEANCEGYAKTFGMLADKCGLENILVTGVTDSGENHAWNQVKIDGEWYNVDVTWDDVEQRGIRWLYFLCDDAIFGKSHIQEKRFIKPFECTSKENNYYVREGLYVETSDEARDLLVKKYNEGAELIDMKFPDSYVYADFKWTYLDDGAIYRMLFDLDDSSTKKVTLSLTENVEEYCMTIEVVK